MGEREGDGNGGVEGEASSRSGGSDKKSCGMAALESLESPIRNRLHVKQSVDHALDTFEAHSDLLHTHAYMYAYFGRYKYQEAAFTR
jgi:hypothetical protein